MVLQQFGFQPADTALLLSHLQFNPTKEKSSQQVLALSNNSFNHVAKTAESC